MSESDSDPADNVVPDNKQLSMDVIRTVDSLMETLDNPDPEDNPMGQMMDPQEMVEMFKPQLRQKVMAKPDNTLEAMAVIHMATSDILDKHASDQSVEELATRGLSREE